MTSCPSDPVVGADHGSTMPRSCVSPSRRSSSTARRSDVFCASPDAGSAISSHTSPASPATTSACARSTDPKSVVDLCARSRTAPLHFNRSSVRMHLGGSAGKRRPHDRGASMWIAIVDASSSEKRAVVDLLTPRLKGSGLAWRGRNPIYGMTLKTAIIRMSSCSMLWQWKANLPGNVRNFMKTSISSPGPSVVVSFL